MRGPFEVPEEVLVDPVTGYAMNISVQDQGAPFWWEDQPEIYTQLQASRRAEGIIFEDFPEGMPERVEMKPISMREAQKRRFGK